jgi:hypothetical protein
MQLRSSGLVALLLLAACSGGDDSAGGPDAPPPAPDADPSGYTELISEDWTLPSGTEQFHCVKLTTTTDLWISGLRPIAPLGTHHTVLAFGDPDGPDGTTTCGQTFALGSTVLYASGVGTEALELPDGVAVNVPAGKQILLNLHLFNATGDSLSGHSGISITTLAPGAVTSEAGVILAGKAIGLQVPPGVSTSTGTCTVPTATQLYAIMPHMHQLGTHMKVTRRDDTSSRVLLDEAYSFGDQRYRMVSPIEPAAAGDTMSIECTYDNPGSTTVTFGESTTDEMCFAITYTIPRITGTLGSAFCVN